MAALAERLDGDTATIWEHPRAGKRVTLWEEALHIEGIERPLRRVLRLTERTIDAQGQLLIEPKLTLDRWTTSLSAKQLDAKAIVALYAEGATVEVGAHNCKERLKAPTIGSRHNREAEIDPDAIGNSVVVVVDVPRPQCDARRINSEMQMRLVPFGRGIWFE